MQTIKDLFPLGIYSDSRILVCMPHPDDEAVFVSGMLDRLSSLNIKTKVLTFTKGEKSTLRYGLDDNADLGKVRSIELKNALKALGIKDLEILNFGDGNLENQKKNILSYLSQKIKEFKPTHIITLEPNGIYGHPDHISLSKFVSTLPHESIKILYVTVGPNYILPENSSRMAKKRVWPTKPEFELKLTFMESLRKLQALNSHKSQFRFDVFHPSSFIFFLMNKMLNNEYFVRG